MDKQRLRNLIGSHDLEPHLNQVTDNISVCLCMYFQESQERPEGDAETDDHSWGVWVEEQANRVMDQLADKLLLLLSAEYLNGRDAQSQAATDQLNPSGFASTVETPHEP